MNNSHPRHLETRLDFLSPDRLYEARLYQDDPTWPTRTRVRIDRRPLRRGDRLVLELRARGGAAVHLRPLTP